MSDVCLLDSSFSMRSAFGKETGRPEYSLNTVVTIKKIRSINIISGIEEVDIFDSTPDFLLNFILSPLLIYE